LLDVADLVPTSANLMLTLNRLGTRRDNAILASMYRHLAHWPAYRALAWTMIAPLDADGRLNRSIADITAKARARVARVAARLLSSTGPPEPAIATAIGAAVEPFTGDVIAKTVVICWSAPCCTRPATAHNAK
jgi:hypothetical protein